MKFKISIAILFFVIFSHFSPIFPITLYRLFIADKWYFFINKRERAQKKKGGGKYELVWWISTLVTKMVTLINILMECSIVITFHFFIIS